jgi:hypothetical protein
MMGVLPPRASGYLVSLSFRIRGGRLRWTLDPPSLSHSKPCAVVYNISIVDLQCDVALEITFTTVFGRDPQIMSSILCVD